MKKKWVAYTLIVVELLIQIFGSIYYDQAPDLVWSLGNAILIMVPLVFGLKPGLLCFLPVAVSELYWYFSLKTLGPLLHVASFLLTVLILGLAQSKLKDMPDPKKVINSILLHEISLLGEEALYYGLMKLLLNRKFRWAKVSGTFLSLANPIILAVLIFCLCTGDKVAEEKDPSEEAGLE
jgi:hypothetical protein